MTGLDQGPGGGPGVTASSAGATSTSSRARTWLAAIEHATGELVRTAYALDELSVHQPSLLPGWTRAHILTHLARDADGSLNLLTWAKTGVEHPMYASEADRDADVQEGAVRGHRVLVEDLAASCGRFAEAVRALPETAWDKEISGAFGEPIRAYEVLRMRFLEVWVHLVDLGHDVGFEDIPPQDLKALLDETARQFTQGTDLPAVRVVVDFDDQRHTWELGGVPATEVRGPPALVLGWLLGRFPGKRLTGNPPELPVWI